MSTMAPVSRLERTSISTGLPKRGIASLQWLHWVIWCERVLVGPLEVLVVVTRIIYM